MAANLNRSPEMTDDEARAVLQSDDCAAWIRWDNAANKPDWWIISGSPDLGEPTITVDGDLTETQMLALLHFKPRE